MNKRALIGMIISGILVIILLIGIFLYFQVKNNGLTISSGKFVIDFSGKDKIENISLIPLANTSNLSVENNQSLEQDNLTTSGDDKIRISLSEGETQTIKP